MQTLTCARVRSFSKAGDRTERDSMKQFVRSYVVEFQTEPSRFRKGVRYHWMVSLAQKPDEMISWGFAGTLELAEIAAHNEVRDLESGATLGGRCTIAVR
jgi:hypothetical protein